MMRKSDSHATSWKHQIQLSPRIIRNLNPLHSKDKEKDETHHDKTKKYSSRNSSGLGNPPIVSISSPVPIAPPTTMKTTAIGSSSFLGTSGTKTLPLPPPPPVPPLPTHRSSSRENRPGLGRSASEREGGYAGGSSDVSPQGSGRVRIGGVEKGKSWAGAGPGPLRPPPRHKMFQTQLPEGMEITERSGRRERSRDGRSVSRSTREQSRSVTRDTSSSRTEVMRRDLSGVRIRDASLARSVASMASGASRVGLEVVKKKKKKRVVEPETRTENGITRAVASASDRLRVKHTRERSYSPAPTLAVAREMATKVTSPKMVTVKTPTFPPMSRRGTKEADDLGIPKMGSGERKKVAPPRPARPFGDGLGIFGSVEREDEGEADTEGVGVRKIRRKKKKSIGGGEKRGEGLMMNADAMMMLAGGTRLSEAALGKLTAEVPEDSPPAHKFAFQDTSPTEPKHPITNPATGSQQPNKTFNIPANHKTSQNPTAKDPDAESDSDYEAERLTSTELEIPTCLLCGDVATPGIRTAGLCKPCQGEFAPTQEVFRSPISWHIGNPHAMEDMPNLGGFLLGAPPAPRGRSRSGDGGGDDGVRGLMGDVRGEDADDEGTDVEGSFGRGRSVVGFNGEEGDGDGGDSDYESIYAETSDGSESAGERADEGVRRGVDNGRMSRYDHWVKGGQRASARRSVRKSGVGADGEDVFDAWGDYYFDEENFETREVVASGEGYYGGILSP